MVGTRHCGGGGHERRGIAGAAVDQVPGAGPARLTTSTPGATRSRYRPGELAAPSVRPHRADRQHLRIGSRVRDGVALLGLVATAATACTQPSYSTAARSSSLGKNELAETLMTEAPAVDGHRMDRASVDAVPSLGPFACRTGRIVAPGARPTMPVPGPLGWAAMIPATKVPWP